VNLRQKEEKEMAMFGGIVRAREEKLLKKKTTKKAILEEGLAECRKIQADAKLTEKEKVARIKNKVQFFVEKLIEVDSNLPEIRAWRKRESEIEKKYTPSGKYVFCLDCGWWVRDRKPPEAVANDATFTAVRRRKVDELLRKILGRKAA
jgi:hypothetical protein